MELFPNVDFEYVFLDLSKILSVWSICGIYGHVLDDNKNLNNVQTPSPSVWSKRLDKVPNISFGWVEEFCKKTFDLPKKIQSKGWRFFISGCIEWEHFEFMAGMANLRGLRGSEWVGVGCVGRSGLSGSKVKPHFHASLIFSDPLQPNPTHSDPLQPTPIHSTSELRGSEWVGVG